MVVGLGYDLDRAMQIFKPLRPGAERNTLQHADFFTVVRSPIYRGFAFRFRAGNLQARILERFLGCRVPRAGKTP